jgi:hypothetical protein
MQAKPYLNLNRDYPLTELAIALAVVIFLVVMIITDHPIWAIRPSRKSLGIFIYFCLHN